MMALEFATRLAFALMLGAVIGVERQWQQRLAGLRTPFWNFPARIG